MFSFTSQNVYKGNTAVLNIYSGLDRGNEEIDDGVNLRLPSGSAKDWGNLDYDVNLMLADNAFDGNGQPLTVTSLGVCAEAAHTCSPADAVSPAAQPRAVEGDETVYVQGFTAQVPAIRRRRWSR
jgi:hypothetical protein